jgi:hypothetical protein
MNIDTYIQEAAERGKDAAIAAASWVTDGNSDTAERRRVLEMMRVGDDVAGYLPRQPDLSGEWADAPTPTSLGCELVENWDDLPDEEAGEIADALANAFEDAVSETFESACERQLLDATVDVDRQHFLRGYIECALWSSVDDGAPLDQDHDATDIAADAREKMAADCRSFVDGQYAEIEQLEALTGRDSAAMGYDLWLTRNGHGAGYWDRYMEADEDDRHEAELVGRRLSETAREMGESALYVGDDGSLYV